jgi:outer membrane receptor for ferrienterochelin and colicins
VSRLYPITVGFVLAVATLSPTPARAQVSSPPAPTPSAAPDLEALEGDLSQEIVSTTSRTAELARLSPATSVTVSAEDIHRFGMRSLDEVINFFSPGMFAAQQEWGTSDPGEVGARGVLLTQDLGCHVLLLLNGHSMNEVGSGFSAFDISGIPMESIDHVEIIMGAGPLMYGANAMLGVVNVITRDASHYAGVHVLAEGGGSTPTSNSNLQMLSPGTSDYLSRLGHAYRLGAGLGETFSLFGKEASLLVQIEARDDATAAYQWGPQPTGLSYGPLSPSGQGQWGGLGRWQTASDSGLVTLRVGDIEAMVSAARVTLSDYQYVTAPIGPDASVLQVLSLRGDIKYRHRLTSHIDTLMRAYADSMQVSQANQYIADLCAGYGITGACTYQYRQNGVWGGLEEQATFDWFNDGAYVTTAGLDGRVRDVGFLTNPVDSTGAVGPSGSVGVSQGTYLSGAAFLQQSLAPVKQLRFLGGARYDYDQLGGGRLVPRAVLAILPTDTTTVKVIYGQAFRNPTQYQQYYWDGTVELQASPLKQETVQSEEVSLEQRFLGTQKVYGGVFASQWQNLINYGPVTQAQYEQGVAAGQAFLPNAAYYNAFANTGSINAMGFNVGYDGTAAKGRVRYGMNFSVTQANNQTLQANGTTQTAARADPVLARQRATRVFVLG